MTDFLKTWTAILIPILGLLAGSGWLQYYLNRRSASQETYRTLLEDFLLPLQSTLQVTQKIFNKLRDDRELSNLEYHPGRLKEFFSKLPNDDPRKHLWRAHIEWLQTENARGVELIHRFYGRILLPDFSRACDEFVIHAKEWEVMWKALMGGGNVPPSLDTSGSLCAPKFPAGFEEALAKELLEVKKRAGK